MNDSEHIKPEKYADGLRTGASSRADDEHVANCNICRAEVEKYIALDKQKWQNNVLGTFLHFTTEIARSTVAMVLPPLKKAFEPETRKEEIFEPKVPQEPLRLFPPQTYSWIKNPQGKFVAVVLFTLIVFLLPAPSGLSGSAHRAMVVFIFTAGILTFQPVSLPLAALMIPVTQILFGVANVSQSFEPFSRPVVFLILASLFLAQALSKHRITRRLALQTIISSDGDVRKLLFGLMGIAALLSMWVENTATAAVLIPVALTISREVKDKDEARSLLVLLVLGIAYSASLGGMVTIMGSASNAVASGFLEQIRPWSFLDWTKYGLPPFLIIFPVTFWLLLKMVPVSVSRIEIGRVEENLKEMGRMSGREKEIIATMVIAALFWIFGATIEKSLNLPPTMLSSGVVAVVAVLYLAVRQIINWEDIQGVSWGIFFIIGAGLSLGDTLTRSGATEWIAVSITPLVTFPPLWVSLLLLVIISATLTNVLNNTTIAAVLVPVLINIAVSNPEFNAVQLVIPVTLATTFGYSLPSASGRMALIGASGLISGGEMLKYGLIATIVSSAILAAMFYWFAVMGWI